MKNRENKTPDPLEFQLIFDELEEIKAKNQELFILNTPKESSLLESIREIQKVVDALNTQDTFITFTRV